MLCLRVLEGVRGGKESGQGAYGVRILALTVCQAPGPPCGSNMAETRVLLSKDLLMGLPAAGGVEVGPWGSLEQVLGRGHFTAVMKGHQFTQERVEEAPQGTGTACAGLGSCLSVESLRHALLMRSLGCAWVRKAMEEAAERGPRMPAEVSGCLVDGVMEGADTD